MIKEEPLYNGFCIGRNKKLQCNECLLQLNYRDVDILKRHLRSVRHVTHVKLNRFEQFYNKWCDDKTQQITLQNNELLRTIVKKLNGLILARKNREPVSESLINETVDEARSLLTTNDLTSVGGFEESLFDMSLSGFSTVKKPEKSPEQKYKLY